MRFLVVDDSTTMRRIIINTLNKLGYTEIVEAGNGREGIDRVSEGRVDLIITDWNMPEMNGIDFLKALRTDGITTTFGFVTSESTPAMRETAAQAGAAFLLAKPFSADDFQELLAAVV